MSASESRPLPRRFLKVSASRSERVANNGGQFLERLVVRRRGQASKPNRRPVRTPAAGSRGPRHGVRGRRGSAVGRARRRLGLLRRRTRRRPAAPAVSTWAERDREAELGQRRADEVDARPVGRRPAPPARWPGATRPARTATVGSSAAPSPGAAASRSSASIRPVDDRVEPLRAGRPGRARSSATSQARDAVRRPGSTPGRPRTEIRCRASIAGDVGQQPDPVGRHAP